MDLKFFCVNIKKKKKPKPLELTIKNKVWGNRLSLVNTQVSKGDEVYLSREKSEILFWYCPGYHERRIFN